MTNYIILALCLVVLLSYIFDITSKYSKIPGVILLIALGIAIQILFDTTGFKIPDLKPVLPVIGTLGLILIVLEASLDIKLEKSKKKLIFNSISSAIILFAFFVTVLTFIMVKFLGFQVIDSLLNAIPLGIISSAVAITSAVHLNPEHKEFIVYESAFSDIAGILVFDFILLNRDSIGYGLVNFAFTGVLTVIIAIVTTSVLAILLHKIRYHVNYVIIMTAVVMTYTLAKIYHLPALLLVLVFGMALSNYKIAEQTIVRRFVDFNKFRNDLDSFKKILGELTFIVRSFFFIMFGYYTRLDNLVNTSNIIIALCITSGLLIMRWLYFSLVLKMPAVPLVFFAPRGLITILLFLSIPAVSRIPMFNEEVTTLVILFTLIIMMIGNFLSAKDPGLASKSGKSESDPSEVGEMKF